MLFFNFSEAVIAAAAKGIVRKKRPQALKENGGSLELSERWGWAQIHREN